MTSQLINVVRFTGLVVGAPTSLPHGLNNDGDPLVPDVVAASASGFSPIADNTNVTVTRGAITDPASVDVITQHWYSAERILGSQVNLTPQPFVFGTGGSGGGGGGTATQYVFVYRPGGVAVDNVFTSWPSLMTALGAVQGEKILEFDTTFVQPIPIPAGGPYDMTDVIWTAKTGSVPFFGPVTVEIADGASFTGLRTFQNISVRNLNTVTSPIVFGPGNTEVSCTQARLIGGAGTVPMFSGAGMGAGDAVLFSLITLAVLKVPGVVIDMPVAGTQLVLLYGPEAEVDPGALTGAVGTSLVSRIISSGGSRQPGLPGFLGTQATEVFTHARLTLNPETGNSTVPLIAGDINSFFRLDTTAAPFAQSLPSISGGSPPGYHNLGKAMVVKNFGTLNNLTVQADIGDSIESAPSIILGPGASALLISDGINQWLRVI